MNITKFRKQKGSDSQSMIQKIDQKNKLLQKNWSKIKKGSRFEIHFHGYNLSKFTRQHTERINQKKNIQITRILRLRDPLLKIIYILPFELKEEISDFYNKLFQFHNIDIQGRLFFMVPQYFDIFPPEFSFSQIIFYSQSILQQIKDTVGLQECYMIGSQPSLNDYQLAVHLDYPLYCGNSLQAEQISQKYESKQLFENCGIETAFGIQIKKKQYDIDKLFTKISQLICENAHINIWVFKINNQQDGMGIAALDINPYQIAQNNNIDFCDLIDHQLLMFNILKQSMCDKLYISCKNIYKNSKEYLNQFIIEGGIIEIHADQDHIQNFSILLEIQPNGEINIEGTYQKFQTQKYCNSAIFYPQNIVKENIIKDYSQKVGKKIYQLGIQGYISLDFLTFLKNGQQQIWGLGIDAFMNNYICGLIYFDFLINGKYNEDLNIYESQLGQRSFMYFPYIYQPNLKDITQTNFFRLFRENNILFDLANKKGTGISLSDNVQKGVISIITIGNNQDETIKYMNDVFNFIIQQIGDVKKYDYIENKIIQKQYTQFMDQVVQVRKLNKLKNNQKF